MPNLREAAVLLLGNVISIEATTNFDTKAVDGIKCLVHAGDGFANVKLKTEYADAIKPQIGHQIAWWVRPGANGGRDRDAVAYTSFVGVADASAADLLNSRVQRKAAA